MNRDEIRAGVQEIFREIFDDGALSVTDGTSAADIGEWDSLEQVNILVAAERMFAVKFSVTDLENLKTVGGIVDLIRRKLNER